VNAAGAAQATKVFCMAMEICDDSTKAEWQPCAYSSYRWWMEQEIGRLYACFGGPEEGEAVTHAQRKGRTWLAKAHEGVERARDHIVLHLRVVTETDRIERHEAVSGLGLPHHCQHGGPPEES
jgi:hypothetical protein